VKKSSETVTVKDGVPLANFETNGETVFGFKPPGSRAEGSGVIDKKFDVEVGVCLLLCLSVGIGINK
jgi:hypothetical protein